MWLPCIRAGTQACPYNFAERQSIDRTYEGLR